MAWDVLSRVAKMAWDVLSGVTKTAWDVLSGWQIDAGCFVRGGKKWHGMFCPGMFCHSLHIHNFYSFRDMNLIFSDRTYL